MFTVIMPVHNKAPHLRRSIDSVLNQTFREFELILIDDASTDGSNEILRSYIDPRIKVLDRLRPGPGGYAARNLGVNSAKYDWISFIDADDSWEPTFLEYFSNAIFSHPTAEFFSAKWDNVYSDRVVENSFFDRFNDLYVSFTIKDFFYQNFFVWTSAVTVKKSLLINAGLFPENRCTRGGDMDAWIRCLDISVGSVWINIKLAHYFKETVNQVTSNKNNPVLEICALPTIEKLRKKSSEVALHRAIDAFLSKILYNKLISDYRRTGVYPSYRHLKPIENLRKKMFVLLKSYVRIAFFEKSVK